MTGKASEQLTLSDLAICATIVEQLLKRKGLSRPKRHALEELHHKLCRIVASLRKEGTS